MAWARLDDKLHQNPKIAQLSDAAFRLWIQGITFASAHASDGRLLGASLPLIWPSASPQRRLAAAKELVRYDCWRETVDGWEIHDFLDYNPSADESRKKVATKSNAGTYGNHKRWHEKKGRVDPECEWCRTSDRARDPKSDRGSESHPDRPTRPDPSRPVPTHTATPSPEETPEKASPPAFTPAREGQPRRATTPPGAETTGGEETRRGAAETAGDLWAKHKRRTLRQDEMETINACRSRFGEDLTVRGVQAAIDRGDVYASRIELRCAELARPPTRDLPPRTRQNVAAIEDWLAQSPAEESDAAL